MTTSLNANSCATCQKGYALVSGICSAPFTHPVNFAHCTSGSSVGICATCENGWFVATSGVNINVCEPHRPAHNCKTYSLIAATCLTCELGFWFTNGECAIPFTCTSCSTKCATGSSQTVCTSCDNGYYVYTSGTPLVYECKAITVSNCKTN